MGKPAVVMFVGVKTFSDEDLAKLPSFVRRVYLQEALPGETKIPHEVVVDKLKFELIWDGKPDTADPGEAIGFGVILYQENYDSGTVKFNPYEIGAIADQTVSRMWEHFTDWGLAVQPAEYICCLWRS